MVLQMVLMINFKMDLVLLFKQFIYKIVKLQIIMEGALFAPMDFSQKTTFVCRHPIYAMVIIFKQELALHANLV